jgi:dTMP kinase
VREGRFIVLDGPDGCGKSTQTRALFLFLESRGIGVLHVRDPGATRVGEKVRDILLDREHTELTPMAECLLFMASRAQLIREKIRPALEDGRIVLCERWVTSTVSYQGFAGGLDPETIWQISEIAADGLEPDLTLILDVDADLGITRISGTPDLVESRSLEFHRMVREGFLRSAAEGRMNARLVPSGTLAEVTQAIREAVDEIL